MYHLELLGVEGGAKEAQELKSTLFLMYPSMVLDMVLTRLKVHLKKVEVVCITSVCSFVFLLSEDEKV